MVTLIIGKKGSGKTKKLIERANEAISNSNGNVVVIEKGLKLTYDISHQARLIDIDAYGIQGLDSFFGFVSGICAGNYDVTDIFVDSTLKIIGPDTEALAILAEKLSALAALADTKITLSVSADAEELPKSIDAVSIKI
jgi:energy-coupling factor transporter ATP-binding protein EcfA2